MVGIKIGTIDARCTVLIFLIELIVIMKVFIFVAIAVALGKLNGMHRVFLCQIRLRLSLTLFCVV